MTRILTLMKHFNSTRINHIFRISPYMPIKINLVLIICSNKTDCPKLRLAPRQPISRPQNNNCTKVESTHSNYNMNYQITLMMGITCFKELHNPLNRLVNQLEAQQLREQPTLPGQNSILHNVVESIYLQLILFLLKINNKTCRK